MISFVPQAPANFAHDFPVTFPELSSLLRLFECFTFGGMKMSAAILHLIVEEPTVRRFACETPRKAVLLFPLCYLLEGGNLPEEVLE